MATITHTLAAIVAVLALATVVEAQDYSGMATYSNINGGVCSGGTNGLPAVSINAAQFGGGSACGQCVQITGTGNGAGGTPVSTSSYIAIVNNVCPQCAYGDIDLQSSGNGKFGISWTFVACPSAGRKLIEELPEQPEQTPEDEQAAVASSEESLAAESTDAALEEPVAPAAEEVAESAEDAFAADEPTEAQAGEDSAAAAPAERPLITSRRLLRTA